MHLMPSRLLLAALADSARVPEHLGLDCCLFTDLENTPYGAHSGLGQMTLHRSTQMR